MVFDGHLYFPSRTQFNDPFDCIAPLFDGIPRKRLNEFLECRAMDEFAELSVGKRRGIADEFKQKPYEHIRQMAQDLADDLGILSLSEKPDNILMWSHYANSHQGFCLEFDVQKQPFKSARRVKYQQKRCVYDLSAAHEKKNAEHLLLTKYAGWRYEAEWRIIIDKCRTVRQFRPEALTGVIWGCRMLEANKVKVRNWINESPCRPLLYQATPSRGHFKLEIEPYRQNTN